jgi:hypothetical protein
MSFNPLTEKGIPLEKQLRNWSELNVQPYNSKEVHPYTRTRIITMNGVEVESILFSHQFARHTADPEIRKYLAQSRRIEQQQQKAINWLTPAEESTLQVTIGYEQVAVDLTAYLARTEPDPYLKQAFEFGLLEDFDHLYRYANLLDMLEGKKAEAITGQFTEIMPGRPTVDEHRHPIDDVRKPSDRQKADPLSLFHVMTLVASEQQTMNWYMNVGNRPMEPLARGLYLEIAQIEEEHVTPYESLLDPTASWFERDVMHQYNECYLYYSFMQQEPDPRIKQIWELHLNMEIEQLRMACEMMRKHEKRDPESFLPKELPEPVLFQENKDYIRQVLESQVNLTGNETEFVAVDDLPQDHRYCQYQKTVNEGGVPSEQVIQAHEGQMGKDYRSQPEGKHPVAGARR